MSKRKKNEDFEESDKEPKRIKKSSDKHSKRTFKLTEADYDEENVKKSDNKHKSKSKRHKSNIHKPSKEEIHKNKKKLLDAIKKMRNVKLFDNEDYNHNFFEVILSYKKKSLLSKAIEKSSENLIRNCLINIQNKIRETKSNQIISSSDYYISKLIPKKDKLLNDANKRITFLEKQKEILQRKLEDVTMICNQAQLRKDGSLNESKSCKNILDRSQEKQEIEEKKKAAADFAKRISKEQKEIKQREQIRKLEEIKKIEKQHEMEEIQRLKEMDQKLEKRNKNFTNKAYERMTKRNERKEKFKQLIIEEKNQKSPDYYYLKNFENQDSFLSNEGQPKKYQKGPVLSQRESLDRNSSHIEKYKFIQDENENERSRKKLLKKESLKINQREVENMKSSLYEKLEKEEQQRKEQEQIKKELSKRRISMMKGYSLSVKEIFKPKQSEKLKDNLDYQIKHLRHPVRQQKDVKNQYTIQEVNSKVKLKPRLSENKRLLSQGEETKERNQKSLNKINEQHTNSTLPDINGKQNKAFISKESFQSNPNEAHKVKKYLDYSDNEAIKKRFNWNKDIKNSKLNLIEMSNIVLQKANKIHEEANAKDKLLRIKSNNFWDVQKGEEIADLYLNAINAKFAILDKMQT